MDILRIGLGAIIGTSFMTLFSYLYSTKRKRQFREPELLNELLNVQLKSAVGWLLHYAVGLGFVIVYHFIWTRTGFDITLGNATLIGLITGIVGCLIWEIAFRIHPNPPDIVIEEYFLQLIIAHIIFGIIAFCGYQLPALFS